MQMIKFFFTKLVILALLFVLTAHAASFSFSKTIAASYQHGDTIPVMTSPLTSRAKVMPMPWSSINWCPLARKPRRRNIGQLFFGDKMVESGYELHVGINSSCKVLCTVSMTPKNKKHLEKLIEGRYRGHVYVDDLPGLENVFILKGMRRVRTGFPLGSPLAIVPEHKPMVNNHLSFVIFYHPVYSMVDMNEKTYRIVHFQVSASSVQHNSATCSDTEFTFSSRQPADSDKISYSYSVHWVESDLPWSTRWDVYMKVTGKEARVHWFSIINFMFVTLIQTVVLWYVLIRALRRDISYYNDSEIVDREEKGWKLVHGDVFRRPRGVGLLSICVGTGAQLALMVFSSLCAACFGFISPQSRGVLATLLLLLFIAFSIVNGFITATLIKFFKARSWKIIISSSFFYPAQMFFGYFILNFFHLGTQATSAASFSSILVLLLLWQGVSTPLVILGAAFGFGVEITVPVKTNNIPRTIPPAPWYMDSILAILFPGLVIFAASHVEITYIFSSVWHGTVYYMFGFLMAVYVLSVVIASQMAVFSTYIQLNRLNYHWWWRSFFTSGSYGVWIFLYSIFYYFYYSTLKGFMSTVLFFGYMGMASYTLALLSGSVGFLAAFLFVKIIYSNVKVE